LRRVQKERGFGGERDRARGALRGRWVEGRKGIQYMGVAEE